MKKSVDYKLFFTAIALMIFGMIMISSVSVWGSFRVTSSMASDGLIQEPYNHFYVIRNIIHIVLSLGIIGLLVKVPFRYYEIYSRHIFSLALVLLIAVLMLGENYKGATGWISIPGVPFTIQPTEFLKFALVVFLAAFLKKYRTYVSTFQNGFLPFIFIVGLIVFLVGAQPDFGTILVVVPVSFMMFFVAGANLKHVFLMGLIGFIVAFGVYSAGEYDPETGKNINSLGYITQRIDNFMAGSEESINNKTINYQTEQALIAIGSGGFFGLGFGNSVQKFGYLPEVQGDFIFSVIAEELGFVGILLLLSLYLHIGYRGMYIYKHSPDLFARYAAFGITSWILLQAYINIGVNLNIVPLTGITLPFVSYGGSSILSLSMGLALLLSISRDIVIEEKSLASKRRNSFSLKRLLGI